jgi:hypothetical protein
MLEWVWVVLRGGFYVYSTNGGCWFYTAILLVCETSYLTAITGQRVYSREGSCLV